VRPLNGQSWPANDEADPIRPPYRPRLRISGDDGSFVRMGGKARRIYRIQAC